MPIVSLEDAEWQQVMAMISLSPWRDANPLLMKIGQQLQQQAGGATPRPGFQQGPGPRPIGPGIRLDGNGKEIRDE